MKKISIEKNMFEKIRNILEQFWWPVKDNYPTRVFTDLTTELIMEVRDIFRNFKDSNQLELDMYQYFTLLRVLDFFLLDMGVDEFSTVTGLDYYEDGIVLLNDLRRQFIWLPI